MSEKIVLALSETQVILELPDGSLTERRKGRLTTVDSPVECDDPATWLQAARIKYWYRRVIGPDGEDGYVLPAGQLFATLELEALPDGEGVWRVVPKRAPTALGRIRAQS